MHSLDAQIRGALAQHVQTELDEIRMPAEWAEVAAAAQDDAEALREVADLFRTLAFVCERRARDLDEIPSLV